jgi:uncharacterized protein with HEPN domain
MRNSVEAIANIETDIMGYDFERFRADRRTRQLVERNLEILSEAGRRLPSEYKDREVQIPWRAIAGIGNVLRHDYHETRYSALISKAASQRDLEQILCQGSPGAMPPVTCLGATAAAMTNSPGILKLFPKPHFSIESI